MDEDKNVTMGPCSQGPCDLFAGTSWSDNANPQPRHFHGELRGPGGGLVATSEPINGEDNRLQGGLYGNFVTICHLNTGDAFLGIPLAPEFGINTQTRICNGH